MAGSKFAKAYESQPMMKQQCSRSSALWVLMCIVFFIIIIYNNTSSRQNAFSFALGSSNSISLATWNMAAINNNPFEYWITTDMIDYNVLMENISNYIQNPGHLDTELGKIFTDTMFEELVTEMSQIPKMKAGLETVRQKWSTDYKLRKSLSQFLKDPLIGKKRLASMPDRLTNTISSSVTGGLELMRPTVINCYAQDMSTISDWWNQWRDFMFRAELTGGKDNGLSTKVVDTLLPISCAKYPAITEDEAAASLPLQLLSLALFDIVLVNLLNTVAPNWQPVRELLCTRLNRRKAHRSVEILGSQYANADVLFLQEVGSKFLHLLGGVGTDSTLRLSKSHQAIIPSERDGDRDQNSVIMLRQNAFVDVKEVTASVVELLKAETAADGSTIKVPVSRGDLIAITALRAADKCKYLLCSFHGDTNGLATIPVLAAVHKYAVTHVPDHILLFGMDANSYAAPEKDQLDMQELATFYRERGMNSCYGPFPDSVRNVTTCHARTFLQPQLNKVTFIHTCSYLTTLAHFDSLFILYDGNHFLIIGREFK